MIHANRIIAEKIPEPFVICNFCNQKVDSTQCIRAKQKMIFMKANGTREEHPAGTTICVTCLEKKRDGTM